MAVAALKSVAFERIGGESSIPGQSRPVDLVHLTRQTSGDRALESDILCLFRQQLTLGIEQLKQTKGRERMLVAHTLKGSSRSIGAFGLSRLAERVEEMPNDDVLIGEFCSEADRVRDFISSICR